MPSVVVMLDQTEHSIFRNVIFTVIDQLKSITKISGQARILFKNSAEVLAMPGSDISNPRESRTQLISQNHIEIQVDENYHEGTLSTVAIDRYEQEPVFMDKKLGVIVKPIYSTQDVIITFKLSFPSESQARRYRDDLRVKMAQLRDVLMHTVSYHYTLPASCYQLLTLVHTLRENVEGYGEDFETYFQSCARSTATQLTTQSGKTKEIAFKERQNRILGYFDFSGLPEKLEIDKDRQITTMSISYKFQYDKVLGCHVRYPIIIHNQLLPEAYLNTNAFYELDQVASKAAVSLEALSHFDDNERLYHEVQKETVFRLPPQDDFQPKNILRGTVAIFTALCTLDDQQPQLLLNLGELGDLVIDPDVMAFLRGSESGYLGKFYQSVYNVSLYVNEMLMEESLLTVDSQLNVKLRQPGNPRNVYHVRFSVLADLDLAPQAALKRMKAYPLALLKTLGAIENGLFNFSFSNDLAIEKFFSDSDVRNFMTYDAAALRQASFSLNPGQEVIAGRIIDRPEYWYALRRNQTRAFGAGRTVMTARILAMNLKELSNADRPS